MPYRNEFWFEGVVTEIKPLTKKKPSTEVWGHAAKIAGLGVEQEVIVKDPAVLAALARGVEVRVSGHVGRNGYNPELVADAWTDLAGKSLVKPAAKLAG